MASFIAGDVHARRLELGHDGKLPELRLEEVQRAEEDGVPKESANPWLLIGVLGFSILSSIVMLLVDVGPNRREAETKIDARQEIQRVYLEPRDLRAPRPYQQRLRQALQAHSRGDRDAEQRYYREVVGMLRADDLHPLRGLTGDITSDERLKELLGTLLRE